MPRHSNQHKPLRRRSHSLRYTMLTCISLAPEEELRPLIEHYFYLGMTDPRILEHSREHLDMTKYGLR